MKLYSKEAMKDLKSAFDEEVLHWPALGPNKRFGCPCYEAQGKLFAFLVTKGVVATQLSEVDRGKLYHDRKAAPFSPGGKAIQRWAQLPFRTRKNLGRIVPLVRSSYEAALTTRKAEKRR